MSLDLNRVASQVEDMAAGLKDGSQKRRQHLLRALGVIGEQDKELEKLRRKIAASRTSWLVAELVENPGFHHPSPPTPDEFSVIGSDGSQIDVDRHHSARCYLINIGSVVLKYCACPSAALASTPHLYSDEEDLVIKPPAGTSGREQMIEGALLGIKRSVEECRCLSQEAATLPADSRALALVDGSLILWGLGGKDCPEFVIEEMLDKGFLHCLQEMQQLNKDRRLTVASYISFPRSTDVVNALRIALCPHDKADCEQYCNETAAGEHPCDAVAGVQDRELFANLLEEGDRSALFGNRSSIVEKRYGNQRIYFFYLKVEDEIARVEIPQWVAMDKELLELTHSLVLDQCRRGQGYPVALSESHEQAVVTAADRNNFYHLLELSLNDRDMPLTTSAKSRSKKTRWL